MSRRPTGPPPQGRLFHRNNQKELLYNFEVTVGCLQLDAKDPQIGLLFLSDSVERVLVFDGSEVVDVHLDRAAPLAAASHVHQRYVLGCMFMLELGVVLFTNNGAVVFSMFFYSHT